MSLQIGRYDAVSVSLLLWRTAVVIITIVTSVFATLTAITAAQSSKCAGQVWLLGFRSETSDFLAPAIMSIFWAAGAMIVLKSEKVRQHNNHYNWEVFRFGSARLSFGISVYYSVLIGVLILFVMLTWISITRYVAIASYC
jgi:hypothetical protein